MRSIIAIATGQKPFDLKKKMQSFEADTQQFFLLKIT